MNNQYYGTVIVKKKNPNDDELQHFKYIKREKKNGKWRYYYDTESLKNDIKDKLGYDEKERLNSAKAEYDKYGYNTDDLELALKRSKEREQDAESRYQDAKYFSDPNNPATKSDDKGYVAAMRKLSDSQINDLKNKAVSERSKQESGRKAIADYARAQKEYNSTLLGISEATVNRGKKLIDKLIKNR